jgi:hypothetical protein
MSSMELASGIACIVAHWHSESEREQNLDSTNPISFHFNFYEKEYSVFLS